MSLTTQNEMVGESGKTGAYISDEAISDATIALMYAAIDGISEWVSISECGRLVRVVADVLSHSPKIRLIRGRVLQVYQL